MIDVDHFKKINDHYGHHIGDEALRWISRRLFAAVRQSDFIIRFGGEEFVLVFPGISLKDLSKRCEAIILGIRKLKLEFEGQSIPVTASIGAVTYPDQGNNYNDLLENADKRLYQAKETGKNKFVISQS